MRVFRPNLILLVEFVFVPIRSCLAVNLPRALDYLSQVVSIIELGSQRPRDVVDRWIPAVYIQSWTSGIACIFPVPSHVTIDHDSERFAWMQLLGKNPKPLSMS
jgi:hypothetical protein